MPYIGKAPQQGIRNRYIYQATAGQTTFSGSDANALTLSYPDSEYVDVFQNGILLKPATDYTSTSGTSVVLVTGASLNDVVEIIVYDTFSIANSYTKADSDTRFVNVTGDTMTGSLDLNGTELILDADADTSITADTDDQIDFKTGGTDRMHLVAEKLGIGTTSPSELLHLDTGGATTTIQIDSDTESSITFNDHGGSAKQYKIGTNITDNNSQFEIRDVTAGASRMRIVSAGSVCINKTADNETDAGVVLSSGGSNFVRSGGGLCSFNRLSSDGDLVFLKQDTSTEGKVSVSGSTVSYEGFSGLHESSGIPTNTPIGTVLSTIDELDVYHAKQDGIKGEEDNPKAGQTRADHAKVEVSDTVGDSAVYGVVGKFNTQGKVMVASVGIGSVRVTGACAKGDLLESNGDGTAKVQSDDIIRSKTIGKVTIGNSNTAEKLVSCVLYCG